MLPYDAEALFALYSGYLQDSWLFALPLLILTLSMLVWILRGGSAVGRIVAGVLALGWLWVGLVFHGFYFVDLNFAAPLYAGLFVLQGLLLLWQSAARGRLAFVYRKDIVGWVGGFLLLYALIGYPLFDYLNGHAEGVRLAGLAAGPTALLTIGLLLHTIAPTPLHLFVIPVIWTLVAGFSGWVLGLWTDLLMPLAAMVLLPTLIWKHRLQRSLDPQAG